MEKLDCIANFYQGNLAYLGHLLSVLIPGGEPLDYIIKDGNRCVDAARMAYISLIFMSIKEDMVEKQEGLKFSSKLLSVSLNECALKIAEKDEKGYHIGPCYKDTPEEIIALLRNKIAHGDYVLDTENRAVVLNLEGNPVSVNINKIATFVINSFQKTLRMSLTNSFTRNIAVCTFKNSNNYAINTNSEIMHIINSIRCVYFNISSKDGTILSKNIIEEFCIFVDNYKAKYGNRNALNEYVEKMRIYFNDLGFDISFTSKSIRNNEKKEIIKNFIISSGISNTDCSFEEEVRIIGCEVQRAVDSSYGYRNALFAHFKNLRILDAIKATKSADKGVIGRKLDERSNTRMIVSYDEIISSLLAIFYSLYDYPFEDIYKKDNIYKTPDERKDEFDFSLLDLSSFNPSVFKINDSKLIECYAHHKNLLLEQTELNSKIIQDRINLRNVTAKGNQKAIDIVKKTFGNHTVNYLRCAYAISESSKRIEIMENDYCDNGLYYINRGIIEGIRNSISHGNYFIETGKTIMDATITFRDVFEGKVTFELKTTLFDLLSLVSYDYDNGKQFGNYILGKLSNDENKAKSM